MGPVQDHPVHHSPPKTTSVPLAVRLLPFFYITLLPDLLRVLASLLLSMKKFLKITTHMIVLNKTHHKTPKENRAYSF